MKQGNAPGFVHFRWTRVKDMVFYRELFRVYPAAEEACGIGW